LKISKITSINLGLPIWQPSLASFLEWGEGLLPLLILNLFYDQIFHHAGDFYGAMGS